MGKFQHISLLSYLRTEVKHKRIYKFSIQAQHIGQISSGRLERRAEWLDLHNSQLGRVIH